MLEVKKIIWVDKESYLFLKNYCRTTRGYKPLTGDSLERCWQRVSCKKGFLDEKKGYFELVGITEYTFSLSVERMKKILEDWGLEYVDNGETIEIINL